MVRFYCRKASEKGSIGISLSKYQSIYRASVDFSGTMVITKNTEGEQEIELARKTIEPPVIDPLRRTLIKFANVDHQLIFEYGDEILTFDMGRAPEDAGPIRAIIRPKVEIFGSGKLTLSHVAVLRDIHYTSESPGGTRGRATEQAFQLEEDEYFVLGDNSPNSEDCRWWRAPGIPNKSIAPLLLSIDSKYERNFENHFIPDELRREFEGNNILLSENVDISDVQRGFTWLITDNAKEYLVKKENGSLNIYQSPYRVGIVPRDYLVGKALFVYWPSGFKPFNQFPLGIIPNVGLMRFIYGGSNDYH
jgi:hypothetical protein